MPMANAINLFLHQIVLHSGIPFDVKLPSRPLDISKMTKEQFDAEMQKGLDDLNAGRFSSAKQVRENMVEYMQRKRKA